MNNIQDNIKSLINSLPHSLKVSFALYCAEDSYQYLDDKTKPSSLICIELVKKHLNSPKAVSATELIDAARAASAASGAAYAAYAASAASGAASIAAYAASNAAYAASAAYDKTHNEKLLQYENYLKEMIRNLSELERIIYKLTKLET